MLLMLLFLFKCHALLTQSFGNNPAYYGRFGLAGHEGIDLVPACSDWTVGAVESGTVLQAGRDGAYGLRVTINDWETGRVWLYAHLSAIYVTPGENVAQGEPIGVMGATGNADGAHVHLGVRDWDNLTLLHADNGFKGYVDPLPALDDAGAMESEVKGTRHETR